MTNPGCATKARRFPRKSASLAHPKGHSLVKMAGEAPLVSFRTRPQPSSRETVFKLAGVHLSCCLFLTWTFSPSLPTFLPSAKQLKRLVASHALALEPGYLLVGLSQVLKLASSVWSSPRTQKDLLHLPLQTAGSGFPLSSRERGSHSGHGGGRARPSRKSGSFQAAQER